ncbi:uncharacterized protein CDAR_579151 [Caerostris darwini]|uniref:Prominin-like protein n=1 Tax=Caerostris darwini TaxID=1538125 RepID=A0AAV4RRU4_9ARAC|nr:uncharacterized protein CDAR_579151 [Caerostris darwini]
MSVTPSSKRIYKYWFVLLLCAAVIAPTYGLSLIEQYRDHLDKFNEIVQWTFSPLGSFSVEIVDLFINSEIYVILQETIGAKPGNILDFIAYSLFYTLKNQLGVTLVIALSIFIGVAILFLPCCLTVQRNREKMRLNKSVVKTSIDSRRKGLCLLDLFIVCSAIVLLGAVIVILGSIRGYFILQLPFKFAVFVVEAIFKLISMLLINHENRLNDISRSAFDVIMLLNNVNEDVAAEYIKRQQKALKPVINIATSIKWELNKVIEILESQKTLFKKFLDETTNTTNSYLDNFGDMMNNLKKTYYDNSLPSEMLEPFLNLSKLNLSAVDVESYTKPINKLREISKVNLQAGLQELSSQLRNVVGQTPYDPTDLIEKLKRYSFEEQLRLDKAVSKYISSIATGIRDEMRGEIIGIITKFEGMMMSKAFVLFVILLVIAGLSALFSIGLIVAYHVGLCGTSCFRTTTQNNRKVVRRTVVSHRGGVLLLVFCYIISNFLWISCLCCVFLFLLTSLPLVGCRAVKDMTILDLTLDPSTYLPYHGWYSLLTSNVLNMIAKENIIHCQNDSTFVPTLPDPLVNFTVFSEIKSQLNFTDVVANFTKQISKLSPAKFVGYDTVDTGGLAGVLDSVNIIPSFQVMKGFLIDLNRRNISETHSKMKNDTKVSNAAPLLDSAQKTYDSLVSHLSTALSNSEVFQSTLNSSKLSVLTALKHINYLNWTADALYESVISESVNIFEDSLNHVVNNLIDGLFTELQLAALAFRKSLSICEVVMLFYEKSTVIICNVLLYPVASCFFGFFLMNIFLFLSVLISMKSLKYFFFLPPVFQAGPSDERVILAEDIPSGGRSISSDLKGYEDEQDVPESPKESPSKVNDDSKSGDSKESSPKGKEDFKNEGPEGSPSKANEDSKSGDSKESSTKDKEDSKNKGPERSPSKANDDSKSGGSKESSPKNKEDSKNEDSEESPSKANEDSKELIPKDKENSKNEDSEGSPSKANEDSKESAPKDKEDSKNEGSEESPSNANEGSKSGGSKELSLKDKEDSKNEDSEGSSSKANEDSKNEEALSIRKMWLN